MMSKAERLESHYVYVVRCRNGSLYTGYTKDVERRIAMHNAGKGGRYTRAQRPVALVAFWRFGTQRSAMQVEYQMKRLSRSEKMEIALGHKIPSWTCWDEVQGEAMS